MILALKRMKENTMPYSGQMIFLGGSTELINLGENIRRFRKRKNMTQEELADKLYVTRQTVSSWENGKSQPDLEMLGKTAEVLGTELSELLEIRKTEYPRFQKKAVCWAVVLGILTILLTADYLVLDPWLFDLKSTTYRAWPYWINGVGVMPVLRIAAGMLIPCLISLRCNVRPQKTVRTALGMAGILLLLPTLLMILSLIRSSFGLATAIIPAWFFSESDVIRLILWSAPFLAGVCLYPAFVRLKTRAD